MQPAALDPQGEQEAAEEKKDDIPPIVDRCFRRTQYTAQRKEHQR